MTFPQGNRRMKFHLYGIVLLACIGFANMSHSQSDNTCISYMEVMAEYRQAVKTIEEKHQPIRREAGMQHEKAKEDRYNCSRKSREDRSNCLTKRNSVLEDLKLSNCSDWEKVPNIRQCEQDAMNTANEMYRCYEKHKKERRACDDRYEDTYESIESSMSAELLPLEQELKNAKWIRNSKLRRVYDGPGSDNEEVLWMLIEHDLEVCHDDGFRMF